MFIHMVHQTAMRSFSFLWYIRLAQVVIAFLVLILSAVDAHTVQDYAHGCSVPSKIAYNLACVCSLWICLLIAADQSGRLSSLSLFYSTSFSPQVQGTHSDRYLGSYGFNLLSMA